MLSPTAYRRLYRASAWYDLVISWPYATPWTLALMWRGLGSLEAALGLPPLPALNVFAVLFANFFGSVVVVWSAARLLAPDTRLGRYDAVARGLFSLWMIVALSHGASPILVGFLVVEIAFGVLQALPVRRDA